MSGCVPPRSVSLFGRSPGAPEGGVSYLWAAGPCQGAAAPQHVSRCEGPVGSPAYRFISPFFHPSDPHMIAEPASCHVVLKIFPLFFQTLLDMFHHLCSHIYSSTSQGWNPHLKRKSVSLQDLLSYMRLTLVFRRTAQPAAAAAAAAAGNHTSATRLSFFLWKISVALISWKQIKMMLTKVFQTCPKPAFSAWEMRITGWLFLEMTKRNTQT